MYSQRSSRPTKPPLTPSSVQFPVWLKRTTGHYPHIINMIVSWRATLILLAAQLAAASETRYQQPVIPQSTSQAHELVPFPLAKSTSGLPAHSAETPVITELKTRTRVRPHHPRHVPESSSASNSSSAGRIESLVGFVFVSGLVATVLLQG